MSTIIPRGRCPGANGQNGAALLILLAILVLATAAILLDRLNAAAIPTPARDPESVQSLARAKSALISWAATHPDTPGLLPFPDRNDDAPANYDGDADCVSPATIASSHLLGSLPVRGEQAGCTTTVELSLEAIDSASERLWYAVSRNLVRGGGGGLINPDIGELATQPWITVRDQTGVVISDRVAAVIIAPGPVVGAQDRGGVAPAAGNYLDSITVGADTYSNADADGCRDDNVGCATPEGEDFFIFPSGADGFNDRLVFITVDELMRAVEDRVIGEAANALRSYKGNNPGSFYPWMSTFTDPRSPQGGATGGSGAMTLEDSTLLIPPKIDFVTAGVSAGDLVRNLTDGSIGPIAAVTPTTLTAAGLIGGATDTFAAGDRYAVHAPNKFRGNPGTVEGMLPLHHPNELFQTGFTATWNLKDIGDDSTDYHVGGDPTYQAADDDIICGVAAVPGCPAVNTITFSDSEGICMWTHKDRVDCYGIKVIGAHTTPSGYAVDQRTVEVQFSFEAKDDLTPTSAVIAAPTAASPRTRSVTIRSTCPSEPADPYADCLVPLVSNMPKPSRFAASTPPDLNVAPFLPQDRDTHPSLVMTPAPNLTDNDTWIIRITDENGANVGSRAVIIDDDVYGEVTLSGIRYDIDVPDELPPWFVENNWHQFVHGVVSGANVPTIVGTSTGDGACTPLVPASPDEEDNCLRIEYNGTMVRDDVEALVIGPGPVLADPPLSQNRNAAGACVSQPAFMCEYFEDPNSRDFALASPPAPNPPTSRNLVFGRVPANTFEVTATFNDQIRAVPP